jgi:hypothetical protein
MQGIKCLCLKALLLPDLYKKFEDLVDKTASQSVFFPIFAHVDMKTIKHDKSGNNKALLDKNSLTTNSKTG